MGGGGVGGHRRSRSPPPPPKVMVGVDLGHQYSGFAFTHESLDSGPNRTRTVHLGELPTTTTAAAGAAGQQQQLPAAVHPYAQAKAPTALLYVKSGSGMVRLSHWGWPAQEEYLALLDRGRPLALQGQQQQHAPGATYALVTGFKAYLEHEPSFLVAGDATDHASARVSARRAAKDFLTQLRHQALAAARAAYPPPVTESQVHWALAVPTAWGAGARRELRACAVAAGMDEHGHLEVVSESDAAAAWCFRAGVGSQALRGRVCLVDGGAGKVCVSACRVAEDAYGRLAVTEEMAMLPRSMLLDCAGDRLDREFLALVSRKAGAGGVRAAAGRVPVPPELAAILAEWEAIKREVTGEPWARAAVTLKVPWKLYAAAADEQGAPAAAATEQQEEEEVAVEITEAEVRGVFDMVADELAEGIAGWLVQLNSTGMPVLLVGAFAASPYVAARVRQSLRQVGGQVVTADDAATAAVQGAAYLCYKRYRDERDQAACSETACGILVFVGFAVAVVVTFVVLVTNANSNSHRR